MQTFYTSAAVLVGLFLLMTPCYARTLEDDDVDGESEDDNWPVVLCAPNTYYSRALESCVVCSECPMNTIITSPCHRFQDTKCGPFYDFNAILEAGRENSESASQEKKPDKEEGDPDVDSATTRSDMTKKSGQQSVGEAVEAEWRSVALKLSLIISGFVVILAAVIIGGVCFIRRRYINGGKSSGVACQYSPAPVVTTVQEC